jgi:hypothetical protein
MRGRASLLLLFYQRRSMYRSTQEGQGPRDESESGELWGLRACQPELLSDVKNLKKRHV